MHSDQEKCKGLSEHRQKFHDYVRDWEKKYEFTDEETRKKIRESVLIGAFLMLIAMMAKMVWFKTHYAKAK